MFDGAFEANERERQITGARRYAAANNSDPFALNRALCHIRVGICDGRDKEGRNYHYDAEEQWETRKLSAGRFSDGSDEYQVRVWRNVQQP